MITFEHLFLEEREVYSIELGNSKISKKQQEYCKLKVSHKISSRDLFLHLLLTKDMLEEVEEQIDYKD